MTSLIDTVLDSYGRRARLYPVFLALLPIFALIFSYTNWLKFEASHLVWFVASGASLFFLADYARQRGKAVEKHLLAKWGGFPSSTLLRHRDQGLDHQTKARYHRAAERLIDGVSIPTAEKEAADPVTADHSYESITQYLLSNTRDKAAFALLFEENVNYGFRRNLLGLKPVALLLLAGTFACLLWVSSGQIFARTLPLQREVILLATASLITVMWLGFVTEASVRASADDYAKQLLRALDVL